MYCLPSFCFLFWELKWVRVWTQPAQAADLTESWKCFTVALTHKLWSRTMEVVNLTNLFWILNAVMYFCVLWLVGSHENVLYNSKAFSYSSLGVEETEWLGIFLSSPCNLFLMMDGNHYELELFLVRVYTVRRSACSQHYRRVILCKRRKMAASLNQVIQIAP